MQSFDIPTEDGMLELGNCWAGQLEIGAILFLTGDLGAGKTTLVRGMLRGMGYHGIVTSPTYTLVEQYRLADRSVSHFDLYRLETPQELEMIGLRDMLSPSSILFFEWPERGMGQLPSPHYRVDIRYSGKIRRLTVEAANGVKELQPC